MKQKAKQLLCLLLMVMMVFSTITPAMAATAEVARSECGDHDEHDHADEQGGHQEDEHAGCSDESCGHEHDEDVIIKKTSTSSISKSLAQKQAACSHTWTTVRTKEPTCGKAGTYETKCSKCGAGNPNGNGSIPATGKHTWTVTSTKNATCTANGSKSYKCSVCGQTKTETITKLGHNYKQVTTKAATCGTTGTYETKCSRCGAGNPNGNGTIPATGKHTWDRSAATCTAAKKCTVCGTVGEAAKGHKWNVSAATCTTDKKCTVCGTVNAKATGHTWNISAATCTTAKKCTKCGTVGQNALGHNYQQVITKNATCGASGTYESKCSRCGAGNPNGNGTIPATGKHTWDRSAATCTAAKKCTVCGTVGEAAKGHTWDRTAATCTAAKKCKTCGTVGEAAKGHTWDRTAATCTAAKKCKTCGTVGEAAKGHTWDRSAATCTAAKKCTVCGTVGEAAKGHTWNISAANCTTAKKCTVCGTVGEAAKGHTWNISAATCTTDKKCTVCGTVGQKALGHDYQQVITKNATCGASGTYVSKCSRCGAGNANGNGTIPATGKHTWDRTAATCTVAKKCTVCGTVGEAAKGHTWNISAATCTTDKKCTVCGYVAAKATGHTWNISEATCTTDKKCKTCGTVGQKALGHNYKQVITKDATCGASGTYESKCDRCGAGNPNGNGTIPATGKHTWNRTAATCTVAKKCTVCGTVAEKALGHNYETKNTTEATCGTNGVYESICSRCGAGNPNGNGTIPATGKHTWKLTSTVAATCTKDGSKKYTCTVCGQTKTETIVKHGHNYVKTTTKQETCGTEGLYVTKCTYCGDVLPDGDGLIPPTGEHTWVYTSTTNATCTTDGYKLYTCSVCKQTKKETITKLGHNFQQVVTKQANCGVAGTYENKCTRCGAGSPNGNGSIPATGEHTWTYTSTTNATCTADGYKLYTCSVCKQTKKETIKKLGHNYQQVVTKQENCGVAGTYETKCTRCGAGSANGNGSIPATGEHTWVYTSTTNATCTAAGYKLYTCSVCKQTKKETIAKLGHNYQAVVTKKENCGYAGTYETKCTRCGEGAQNGNGYIPATGDHTWVFTKTVNPTCTVDGYKLYTCSVCKLTKEEPIAKLGHDYQLVKTQQETCGKAGIYEMKCVRCEVVSATGGSEIPATGEHTWVYTSTTNPTCTTEGYKLYTCDVCKQTKKEKIQKADHTYVQVITKQSGCGSMGTYESKCSQCGAGNPNGNGYIPATGEHTWVYTSTTNPTCTTDGYKLYTCSECKQTKKETIKKLGHDYQQMTVEQPGCGFSGTYVTKCTRCGAGSQNGNGIIPPTGEHIWVYTSTTDPTCTADGYKLYTCTVCDQTKKEAIAKLGHNYEQVITKTETCGTAGTYVTICSVCGAGSPNGNGYIPATGEHVWVLTKTTNPTCTSDGNELYTCSGCAQTRNEVIPKLEHDYQMKVIKEPTCGEAGIYVTVCVRCDIGSQNGNGYIPKLREHSWDIEAPTCTQGQKCIVCGADGEPAKGHSLEWTELNLSGSENALVSIYRCEDCHEKFGNFRVDLNTGAGTNESDSFLGAAKEPDPFLATLTISEEATESAYEDFSSLIEDSFEVEGIKTTNSENGEVYSVDLFDDLIANGTLYVIVRSKDYHVWDLSFDAQGIGWVSRRDKKTFVQKGYDYDDIDVDYITYEMGQPKADYAVRGLPSWLRVFDTDCEENECKIIFDCDPCYEVVENMNPETRNATVWIWVEGKRLIRLKAEQYKAKGYMNSNGIETSRAEYEWEYDDFAEKLGNGSVSFDEYFGFTFKNVSVAVADNGDNFLLHRKVKWQNKNPMKPRNKTDYMDLYLSSEVSWLRVSVERKNEGSDDIKARTLEIKTVDSHGIGGVSDVTYSVWDESETAFVLGGYITYIDHVYIEKDFWDAIFDISRDAGMLVLDTVAMFEPTGGAAAAVNMTSTYIGIIETEEARYEGRPLEAVVGAFTTEVGIADQFVKNARLHNLSKVCTCWDMANRIVGIGGSIKSLVTDEYKDVLNSDDGTVDEDGNLNGSVDDSSHLRLREGAKIYAYYVDEEGSTHNWNDCIILTAFGQVYALR